MTSEKDGTSSTEGNSQEVPDRLERVEAALELVLGHLQTVTKGTEILEGSRTRNMLSSIALGISAVALVAFGSIAVSRPDISVDISRFSIGMALLFLASVIDLTSGMLLQKAISGAVLRKDPSMTANWQGAWHRFFRFNHWARLRKESNGAFAYQAARCTAFIVYVISGAFLIWAVFSL